jgi:hypothetical protein
MRKRPVIQLPRCDYSPAICKEKDDTDRDNTPKVAISICATLLQLDRAVITRYRSCQIRTRVIRAADAEHYAEQEASIL